MSENETHALTLTSEEARVVVEALRIYNENMEKVQFKVIAGDPSASTIPLEEVNRILSRINDVLIRLPDHGLYG